MAHDDALRRAERLSDAAARLLGSPHRLEIVQHLQHNGELTSQQLADLADTTRNAINRHVSGLLEDGWIHVTGTSGGPGRPERILALTNEDDWAAIVAELNRRSKALPTDSGPAAGG